MNSMLAWMRRVAAVLIVCAASAPALAVSEDDLLPVDDAFALSATPTDPGHVQLQWKIAEGYYLYRQRISVQALDATVHAGTLQLPRGDQHHDEFFGEVETYRGMLRGLLPVDAPAGLASVRLTIKYQGCADAGVCYPPQSRTLDVALADATAPVAADDDGLSALSRALGGGHAATPGLAIDGGAPLPPEQAFAFEAIIDDADTLLLRFTPAKGYYLYRDKTSLAFEGADPGVRAGRPRWPPGVMHRDEHFGKVVVYFDQVDVPLPLQRLRPGATHATLRATFQGCQVDGICYPPMTRRIALDLPAVVGLAASPPVASGVAAADTGGLDDTITTPTIAQAPTAPSVAVGRAPAISAAPRQAEDSRLASLLAGSSRGWALLLFFAAGLGLAFTPCVLPMIPILSGLIAGHGTRLGTGRALLLSLVYVVASALVFTVAGVIAGLAGANLQAAFQDPRILVAFAALFVALALSAFGFYELQLPAALRARLGTFSDRQHGGSLAGVAAMGALSALIVGPCVAPPLAAAVLYIGQTRDPVFGGAALFLLAMGMGAPLLAFGVAAGRGLPRSGPWMVTVQRGFGVVFLALAIWMLARVLPDVATLALWGLLLLGTASWALASAPHTPRLRLAARFAGLLLAVLGAAELFGALAGGSDPLQPLAGLRGATVTSEAPAFQAIKSGADLDRKLLAARSAGKPVLFDFYADWCVSCKEMERDTFLDPAVRAALARFVLLKADVTANDAVDQALMRRFGIIGPPGTLFFADDHEQRELRLVGFEKPRAFVTRLGQAAAQP